MSRPLSDQERAELPTVPTAHPHPSQFGTRFGEGWWDCRCGERITFSADPYLVSQNARNAAYYAHVTEQLAAVVQTIADEREAGQG